MRQLVVHSQQVVQIPDRRRRIGASVGTLYVRSRTVKSEFLR